MLGHGLSLINVQAGVALELMDRKPEQARTALSAIKQVSREALVDVQSVLASMRAPGEEVPRAPVPGIANISDLVTRAEAAGLAVEVRQAGERSSLPANVDGAAYRIVHRQPNWSSSWPRARSPACSPDCAQRAGQPAWTC